MEGLENVVADQVVDFNLQKTVADSLSQENSRLHASLKQITAAPSAIPALPLHEIKYTWDSKHSTPDNSPLPRAGHCANSIVIPTVLDKHDSGSASSQPCRTGILLYGGERDNLWLNDVWVWVPKSHGSTQSTFHPQHASIAPPVLIAATNP